MGSAWPDATSINRAEWWNLIERNFDQFNLITMLTVIAKQYPAGLDIGHSTCTEDGTKTRYTIQFMLM